VAASLGVEGLKKTSKYVLGRLYLNYLLFYCDLLHSLSRREVVGVVEIEINCVDHG